VGEKDCQSGLTHSHNSVKYRIKTNKFGIEIERNCKEDFTFDRCGPDGLVPRHQPVRGREVANAE
jgi:hypothetical protein